jgi:hypothetical protein
MAARKRLGEKPGSKLVFEIRKPGKVEEFSLKLRTQRMLAKRMLYQAI